MNISIPRERRPSEYRVGLTPAGVRLLTNDGHACIVELHPTEYVNDSYMIVQNDKMVAINSAI